MFEFLRKLLKKMGGPTPRVYYFELPYKIDTVYLHYGMAQLKSEGIFQRLPKDLQKKWQKALDNWHPVRVTKEDLDCIDDESWEAIAKKLHLKWEYEKYEDESDTAAGI